MRKGSHSGPEWTEEEVRSAIEGRTRKEAGKILGITVNRVSDLCHHFGIKLKRGRKKGTGLAHLRTAAVTNGKAAKTFEGLARAHEINSGFKTGLNSPEKVEIEPEILEAYSQLVAGDSTGTNELAIKMMAKMHKLAEVTLDSLISAGGIVVKVFAKDSNGDFITDENGKMILVGTEINDKGMKIVKEVMRDILSLTADKKSQYLDAEKLGQRMLQDVRDGKDFLENSNGNGSN